MYSYLGIWVDHAQAFIVKSNKIAEFTIEQMNSDVESHHHGGLKGDEHASLTNQRSHDERRRNEMKAFSKDIIKKINNCNEFVIFGPGKAKHELKHEVELHQALSKKLKGIETADKMSEHELKNFVKKFFKLPQD